MQGPHGVALKDSVKNGSIGKQDLKTARVALARKMLSIVYYMLLNNEPYQEEYRPS